MAEQNHIFSEHLHGIFNNLEEFRSGGLLCDVVLKAGEFEMAAHKLILASCSSYFRIMFTSDFSESHQSCVILKDIEPSVLESVVLFAYTGKLSLRTTNAESLLSASCLLQLHEVKNECCQFLIEHISADNCLGIWKLADMYSCKDLLDYSYFYAVNNFEDVIESEEFLSLETSQLNKLIRSDFLMVSSEEILLDAVLKWVKFDLQARCHHSFDILKNIRLVQFTSDFLKKFLQREKHILSANVACIQLIEETECALKHSNISAVSEFPAFRRDYKYADKSLMAIGGETLGCTLDSCECFTLCSEKWLHSFSTEHSIKIAPMNQSRSGFASVSVGRHAYVIGGVSSWNKLESVERYEALSNKWSTLSPLHTPRTGPGAAVIGTQIFVTGGCDGGQYLDSVEIYNPIEDSWVPGPYMCNKRGYAGTTSIDDVLYVCGGCGVENGVDVFLSTVESFDTQVGRWMDGPPLLHSRAYFGLASLNGSLYAVGGYNSKWLNLVERWDPREATWVAVKSMESSRSSAGVSVLDNSIYYVGGFDGHNNLNFVRML